MDEDAISSLLGLRHSTDSQDNNDLYDNNTTTTTTEVVGNEIDVLLDLKNSNDAHDDFGKFKGIIIIATIIISSLSL